MKHKVIKQFYNIRRYNETLSNEVILLIRLYSET